MDQQAFTEATRLCRTCGVVKPLGGFYRDKTKPLGHGNVCKPCFNAQVKRWQKANPGKHASYNKKWREKYPERFKRGRPERRKRWIDKNPEKMRGYKRRSALLKRYGLTVAQFDAMLESQNGLCAICKGRQVRRFTCLAVDHCHSRGIVRGLLCNVCNQVLGMMADDPARLRAAANYLERCQNSATTK